MIHVYKSTFSTSPRIIIQDKPKALERNAIHQCRTEGEGGAPSPIHLWYIHTEGRAPYSGCTSNLLFPYLPTQDKTLIILIIAAIISIVLGVTVEEDKDIAWIEGAAILSAVLLVVVVTAVNDWTKERQFRGLQKKLDTTSKYVN